MNMTSASTKFKQHKFVTMYKCPMLRLKIDVSLATNVTKY